MYPYGVNLCQFQLKLISGMTMCTLILRKFIVNVGSKGKEYFQRPLHLSNAFPHSYQQGITFHFQCAAHVLSLTWCYHLVAKAVLKKDQYMKQSCSEFLLPPLITSTWLHPCFSCSTHHSLISYVV
jgi:hypothetical protein